MKQALDIIRASPHQSHRTRGFHFNQIIILYVFPRCSCTTALQFTFFNDVPMNKLRPNAIQMTV